MKKLKIGLLGLATVVFVAASSFNTEELEIGSQAPMLDHEMQDVSGRSLTMADIAGDNGLLVVFSCNTCPWVKKWDDRYPDMHQIAEANNIGMVAINPNEDYRERGDGFDDMVIYAEKAGYEFPYVLDTNHEVADAFGASRTPHVYLFNGDMELVYVGAIDDNADDANAVTEYYIKDAMEEMVAGEAVSTTNTRSLGCTIKRVS